MRTVPAHGRVYIAQAVLPEFVMTNSVAEYRAIFHDGLEPAMNVPV